MARKSKVPEIAASSMAMRVEKVAPEFRPRRGDGSRFDFVIEKFKEVGPGVWVVLGPFPTSLHALRILAMRGYRRVKEFLGEQWFLEAHMHDTGDGVEAWVRYVEMGTQEVNPGGFTDKA